MDNQHRISLGDTHAAMRCKFFNDFRRNTQLIKRRHIQHIIAIPANNDFAGRNIK